MMLLILLIRKKWRILISIYLLIANYGDINQEKKLCGQKFTAKQKEVNFKKIEISLTDFNGMSTCLWLFQAEKSENYKKN